MRDMVELPPLNTGLPPESEHGSAAFVSAAPHTPETKPAVVWRLHAFDHGGNCYGFETTRSGDRSRVVINGKAALELPRVVWGALLDAAAMHSSDGTSVRPSRAPERADATGASGDVIGSGAIRAGNAWDEVEDEQLRTTWASGTSVAELAILHRRSRAAIARRLERLGLAAATSSDTPVCASASTSPI